MKKVVAVLAVMAGMAASSGAAPLTAGGWTYQKYIQAMQQSGRPLGTFSEAQFAAVQQRKTAYLKAIEARLKSDFGKADPVVLGAFAEVPREYYMFDYEHTRNFGSSAYPGKPMEWSIGYGSMLSDYVVQCYMTQLVHPQPADVSLEIGTGSGFQSSILSRIVKRAYTIEIITALGTPVQKVFAPLGYDNVESRVGDGFYGWPEVKGGFDIIMITCSTPFVPPALLQQLKPNGRLVAPIGQPWRQQFLYIFTKDAQEKVHSRKDASVFFIPMTGAVSKQASGH